MFDPAKLAANNTLKDATARVVSWIKEMLPPDIRNALNARADHVMINAREVACGDPDCSPIDVVLALLFYNGRRAMTGLPMEMNRVRREDIASTLEDMHDELMACHNDTLWVPPSQLGPPPLSAAGNAALEKIAAVISEQLLPLSASDVTGVCAMAMDLLEQIEEDTNRPPPAPVRPGAGLPPRTTVWKSTTGLGISIKSKSIRLIFGRIDCSRRALEARPKTLRRNGRICAY